MPPNWMRVCLGSMFPLFWSDQPRSSAPVLREWNVAPWVLLIVCWESNNDPSRILMSPKKVFARFTFHSNVASFRLIYGGDILSPVAQLRGNVIIRTGTNSRTDWSDVEDRDAASALAGSILAMISPLTTNDDDGPQVFIWRSLRVWVGSIEEIPEAVLDRSTLALILVQGRCGPYRLSCQIFKVHVEGNEQLVVDEERLKMEGVLHNVEWRTSFIFSWLRGSRM